MSRRRLTQAERRAIEAQRHTCGECAYAYDHQRPSMRTGTPTMCRCPHAKDGKYYILTCAPACEKFKSK